MRSEVGVSASVSVCSAHRNIDELARFVDRTTKEGARVYVGVAGLAAALPGALAGLTGMKTPVIGVPMDEHGIDLWLSPPALGAAPHGLGSTGDPVMNIPWTQAGMPALCVPAGRNERGLPMGLQVAGRFGRDEDVLAWGRGIAEAVRPI